MIIQEHPYKGREDLIRTLSNEGKMIKQIETDCLFCDAVDTYPCKFTYEETDVKIFEE